jgi:gas vesicle protein
MEYQEYRNNFICFFAGVLLGGTTALLLAPQVGSRTRRMLQEKFQDGAQSVAEVGHELRRKGQRLADGAVSFADRAMHTMSG